MLHILAYVTWTANDPTFPYLQRSQFQDFINAPGYLNDELSYSSSQ
jgi:hypothetical protein